MHALVIYESMFGNTRRVAEAVAAGIGERIPVDVVEVSAAPLAIEPDVDLVVIGGPTHVHGMTTARTRADAAKRAQSGLTSEGIGIREWLDQVHLSDGAVSAAAFDTRINGPKVLTGSAAAGYARRLHAIGFPVLSDPHSFLIETKAPQDDALVQGEVEEAREWGRALADVVISRRPSSMTATQPVAQVNGPHLAETINPRSVPDEPASAGAIDELNGERDLWAALSDSGELERDSGRRRI